MLRTALLSLAIASPLFAAGCSGKQLAATQIEDPGQRLFNGHVRESVACFECHNGDARGYSVRGPDLAERVPELTDEEILETIWTGPLLMPSYQDILSLEEARSILAWLRKSFPGEGGAE
jgi:mono/diheme cytochrome c family protein